MAPTTSSTSMSSSTPGAKNTSSPSARPAPDGNVIKRLQSELLTLMTSPTPGLSAFPSETSLTTWSATLTGPSGTPYENLTFKLKINFPNNYPYAPPDMVFQTPIYHPNVDFSGRICLDILKPEAWSAVLNTGSVLLSVQSLLGEPNNASPLNGEAALLWDRDQAQFKKKVLARHLEPAELEANGL